MAVLAQIFRRTLTREGRRFPEPLRAICLLALLCLPGTAVAETRDVTLPSGVRLVLEARPATETVSIRILLGGGRLAETAARRGVADLHAALLMRGTAGRSGSEIARAVEALGGRLDAYASIRHETIVLDAPAESLAPALEIAVDVALHPRLDTKDLAKEEDLLAGSIAASHDDPSSYLDDEAWRTLFPGHPFSGLVRLEEREARAVGMEDVRAWQRDRLDGGKIALVVVGKLDPDEVERRARELLGAGAFRKDGSAAGARPLGSDDPPRPAPLADDVRRRVRRRTTQPEILIALPIDGISDAETADFAVLRNILGGFQERLYTEIREERGFAYWVRIDGRVMPTAGWFGVRTGARRKNLPEIEKIVRAALARIASGPPTAEEVERARRYLTTAEARADATNAARCAGLAASVSDGRPLRDYDERAARLAAVTPASVTALARRLFAGKHLAVLTLH